MTRKPMLSLMSSVMLLPAVALLAFTSYGCVMASPGFRYVTKHYSDVEHENFTHDEASYRVFLKTDKLMITASIGEAMAIGFSGAFSGVSSSDAPKIVYRNAAQAYLESKGMDCEITDIYSIITPQWEATFTCATSQGGSR